MLSSENAFRLRPAATLFVTALGVVALSVHFLSAQSAPDQKSLGNSFNQTIKPFFQKNCQRCHNSDLGTAGVRTDHFGDSSGRIEI